MSTGRFNSRALTENLRRMASEVVDLLPDGTQITREERLAELIWKQALGYVEEVRNEEGTLTKVVHKPVAWAQQYLFERMEGKAAIAAPDASVGMRAADKVRALAKDRLNRIAETVTAPKASRPPVHKPASNE